MNTLLKLATEAHGGVGGRQTPVHFGSGVHGCGGPIRRVDNCSLASPLKYASGSERIPRCAHLVAGKRVPGRLALGNDRTVELCCNCCFGAHQSGRSGMLSLRIR
jgi:hypothetical protein